MAGFLGLSSGRLNLILAEHGWSEVIDRSIGRVGRDPETEREDGGQQERNEEAVFLCFMLLVIAER
jgi:hypothetical protein